MRAIWISAVAVLAVLSVTKLHLVRAETGQRETRIVLHQPFSFPIDSADAYCLRRLDQTIYQCASAFVAQRDEGVPLARLPFCRPCAQISGWLSTFGRDRQLVAQRHRDLETIAGMAFDKN